MPHRRHSDRGWEVRKGQVKDSIKRTFAPFAAERSLEFQIQVSSGSPEVIETDPQRLEQVLKNLLSIAIKYTRRGKVTFAVHPGEAGHGSLSVPHNGIGIAKVQQAIVFEAFRQADASNNRKNDGTGLGLFISRQLGHLLIGTLLLASEHWFES